jgi:pimeloyl-ACP methyl ester carboxylesterase
MVSRKDLAEDLKAYLGEPAYEEYLALAEQTVEKVDRERLSIEAPENLIFVPGVMGSLLQSRTKGGVWWIDVRTRNFIDELRLSPDGEGDADPQNKVVPFTTDITYEPFMAAALERKDFGHVVFPYDWRKSLLLSAAGLKDQILSMHENNGGEPVHLVAHSMGGLLVRAALAAHGDELWRKIGRVVFVGTPHYGSPAIAGYLKNHLWGFDLMALMGRYLSRDTFRTLRGVLSLLPAPRGIYPGTRNDDHTLWVSPDSEDPYIHPCANFDMYDADSWKLDLSAEQKLRLKGVLDAAAEFHRDLYAAHQGLDQTLRDRMAVIAGVGVKTLFRLAYEKRFFGLWEHTDKVTGRVPGDPHRDGDGRVPIASAALEDVGDTRYVKGVHGDLPMIPAVYNDVFRWLNGEEMKLPQTPAGALAQRLSVETDESAAPNLTTPVRRNPLTGDPDLWDITLSEPGEIERQEARLGYLEEQLVEGRLPEFIKVKLL